MVRLTGALGAAMLASVTIQGLVHAQDLSKMPQCAEYFDRLENHQRCAWAAFPQELDQQLAQTKASRTEYAKQSADELVRPHLEASCKNFLELLRETFAASAKTCKK